MATEEKNPRGAQFLLTVACIIIVIAGLRFAADLLLPFLVAIFLAVISLPLVLWFQSKKVPSMVSVPLTVALILFGFGVLLYIASGSVSKFTEDIPEYRKQLNALSAKTKDWLEGHGVDVGRKPKKEEAKSPNTKPPKDNQKTKAQPDQKTKPNGDEEKKNESKNLLVSPNKLLEANEDKVGSLTPIKLGSVVGYLQTAINGVYMIISNMFLVILAQMFFLFEAASFSSKMDRAFGDSRFDNKRLGKIVSDIQSYFILKTVISLLTGVLISIWTFACGSELYLLWGLLAFMLNFIPNIGSIIAAIPPTLIALAQNGLTNAAFVGLGFLLVNTIIGNVVEPKVMGRRLGLSTAVVFMSLVFWGWIWGPVGMLLSIPLTMFVKILLENTEDLKWIAVLLSSDED